MAKEKLRIYVPYDDEFIQRVKDEIEDEIVVSSKKWKVRLTEEDKELVRDGARRQVEDRIGQSSELPWTLEEFYHIPFILNGIDLRMDLTTNQLDEYNLRNLYYRRKNRLASAEWNPKARLRDGRIMNLANVEEDYKNLLIEYYRSAVFYGVGSMK